MEVEKRIVPKRVGHAERRTEIADALVRASGRFGLHATRGVMVGGSW